MEEIKSWPKDYTDEEIRDIITQGDSGKANGMASWKEAGFFELELRQKNKAEKSEKINFRIAIVAIVIAFLSLLVGLIK
jgi:hypothetical protein